MNPFGPVSLADSPFDLGGPQSTGDTGGQRFGGNTIGGINRADDSATKSIIAIGVVLVALVWVARRSRG